MIMVLVYTYICIITTITVMLSEKRVNHVKLTLMGISKIQRYITGFDFVRSIYMK
jgi:hypothetical protein